MIPSKNNEAHKEVTSQLITWYLKALGQLIAEGNEAALISRNALENNDANERGYQEIKIDVRSWVYNIHHNTWKETSLAGLLKARVIVMRIQNEET